MRSETPDTYYVNNDWHGVKVGPGPRDAGLFMGGYLNYMYAIVCGNCLAKTYCFLPSTGQLTMPNFFFFCQIYVCNGTDKRIQYTELSFLPVLKAIKAVSCITDLRVSKAISGEL